MPPAELKPAVVALRPEEMRASLDSRKFSASLVAGERRRVEVIARNVGGATWPAVGDGAGHFSVMLHKGG